MQHPAAVLIRRRIVVGLILCLVAAAAGGIVYFRITASRHKPVAVRGRYPTEEAWVVAETVRDIVEMSAYPAAPGAFSIDIAGRGLYQVKLASAAVQVDVRRDVWSPDVFVPVAKAALALASAPAARSAQPIVAHEILVDMVPGAIVSAGRSISDGLKSNMRSPALHEAAAMTVGAFGLRETRGDYYDPRWAMNRITAHLAMAAACGCAAPTVDGRLASAVLMTIVGRQTRALGILDELADGPRTPALDAWIRGLRLRITGRTLDVDPATLNTGLEKQEYFRVRRSRAVLASQLQELGVVPSATWLRLAESRAAGVEDGWIVENGLRLERAEYEDVYRRIHGHDIGPDPIAALNARADRCVGPRGPDILPWGAWAEFEQRQLIRLVATTDYWDMHMFGSAAGGAASKRRFDRELDRLAMFPLGAIERSADSRTEEPELRYFERASALLAESPERVTFRMWGEIVSAARIHERIAREIPPPTLYFMGPSGRMPFDAPERVGRVAYTLPLSMIDEIHAGAPYDADVGWTYLRTRLGHDAPTSLENLRDAYGPLLEYDVRTISAAAKYADDNDERLLLLKKACDLELSHCVYYAWALTRQRRPNEAAKVYERVFADPSVDVVTVAGTSAWLVGYYYWHGRTGAALDLARRGSETGAGSGMLNLAWVYEQLGRFDDAEELHLKVRERYEAGPAQLLAFYYRVTHERGQHRFDDRWAALLNTTFPDGLVRVSSVEGRPTQGVYVCRDNSDVRAQGLHTGDIIYSLEGWRVDNLTQFRAINAFFHGPVVKMGVWRDQPVDLTIKTVDRVLDIEYTTHPNDAVLRHYGRCEQ